jgi:putative membrane protein
MISPTITYSVIDGIHLKQCVSLYLFALPLTLINDLGWSTIPIVTVVAFTLMGIEGIADEIEMPFGKHSVRTNNYVAENSIRTRPSRPASRCVSMQHNAFYY